jgi:hypothetical protein
MSMAQRETICRGCGKPILFIRTVEKKLMPVDAEPVWVKPDREGHMYVRRNGQMIHGVIIGDACDTPDRKPAEAYVSHFATCSQAAAFRKRGKAE